MHEVQQPARWWRLPDGADGPAGRRHARVRIEGIRICRQPVRVKRRVIIGEDQDVPTRRPYARVTRVVQSKLGLRHIAQWSSAGSTQVGYLVAQARVGSVVDDDDLELLERLRLHALEAAQHIAGPAVRRDDETYQGRGHGYPTSAIVRCATRHTCMRSTSVRSSRQPPACARRTKPARFLHDRPELSAERARHRDGRALSGASRLWPIRGQRLLDVTLRPWQAKPPSNIAHGRRGRSCAAPRTALRTASRLANAWPRIARLEHARPTSSPPP